MMKKRTGPSGSVLLVPVTFLPVLDHLEEGISVGKVTYGDARLEGFSLPREVGLGVAVRPAASLLLAADVSWLDWSGSMKTSTLRASESPD
jgi:long-subunit fatty acid transport protein